MRSRSLVSGLLLLLAACREQSRAEPEPPAPAPVENRAPLSPPPRAELPSDAPSAKDWNFPGVKWRSAEAGLAAMRESHRPGLVVVMATWCPRCKDFRSLFFDPQIVELSKHFEMILIDAETSPERADKWKTDGDYFPRTFVASPEGSVDPRFITSLTDYPHFFNAAQKGELVRAMREAIAKYPAAS
jgi:protein-disulfide reductase (glutathione)